jgi:hypothetical protein
MAQRPRAQIRPNTARLGRRHDRHAPADDGADARHQAALARLGVVHGRGRRFDLAAANVSLWRPLESRQSGPLGTWANVGSTRSRAAAGAIGVGRRLGWLLVVVDVGLAPVLLVGVLVG